VAAARQANVHTGRDRLRLAVPAIGTLLEQLAARGEPLRHHTIRLLALLDDHGPTDLAAAVAVALELGALGAGSIAHILDTRRRQRGQRPVLPVVLPNRPGVHDLDLTPPRMETYDALSRSDDDDTPDR
jgi:hypothetical protein